MENFVLFDKEEIIINKNLINYIEVYDNNIRIHVLDMPNLIRRDFKNKFSLIKWLFDHELIKKSQSVRVFKEIAERNREMKAQEKQRLKELSNAGNNSNENEQ